MYEMPTETALQGSTMNESIVELRARLANAAERIAALEVDLTKARHRAAVVEAHDAIRKHRIASLEHQVERMANAPWWERLFGWSGSL
jgi:chromosome segregation ATPase